MAVMTAGESNQILTQLYCFRFKEHINTSPVSEVLSTEELLKLRAEVAAAPPGVTSAEAEPLISVASTAPPGNYHKKLT